MGTTYEGKTSDGQSWTIRIVNDLTSFQVLVIEVSEISTFREANWYLAEQRVRRIISLRGYSKKVYQDAEF